MSSSPISSLSVMFPAYNDAETIADLVCAGRRAAEAVTADYEVIVVNDGSHDQTGRVLAELSLREPRLRVITHPVNRGYGAALRSGFAAATKEWIFYTDGDAQYDPSELDRLADLVGAEVDVVNGWKLDRGDGRARAVIGRLYHAAVQFAFALPVRDTDCDFRLFRRSLLKRVTLGADSGAICLEMVAKFHRSGARFVETPVHHYARRHGQSQFLTPGRVTRTLLDAMGLWWRMSMLSTGR